MRLVHRLGRQPERYRNGTQEIVRIELSGHQLRSDELVGIDLLEQAAHQRGLSRPDFSGNDDEALALVHTVLKVGERAFVTPTAVKECGIGIQLKGFAGQAEEFFVHVTA